MKFLHQVRRVSEVPAPSQESVVMYLCVRVFILPLSIIFFGIFHLISNDSIMYIQGQRKYFKCNTL